METPEISGIFSIYLGDGKESRLQKKNECRVSRASPHLAAGMHVSIIYVQMAMGVFYTIWRRFNEICFFLIENLLYKNL